MLSYIAANLRWKSSVIFCGAYDVLYDIINLASLAELCACLGHKMIEMNFCRRTAFGIKK